MIYLLPVLWFIEWGDGFFREQQKKLSALETELAAAKQEGFTSKVLTENDGAHAKKRHLVVIGIMTRFGNKNNRDAVRKAWMGTGRILWSHGFAFVHIGSVRFCLLGLENGSHHLVQSSFEELWVFGVSCRKSIRGE